MSYFLIQFYAKLSMMKELDFIGIIKKQTGGEYIGDDCAYLKEFGIVVSQDNLVEGVHFKREWCTPYQLGYKSIAVNISDILASGAKPEFVTIGLSLPDDIDEKFIEEFYRGAKAGLYGAKIIGGDITGADKIFISVTAIGSAGGRKISSRKNAKPGYAVITKGPHGLSAKGLEELQRGGDNQELIKAHLEPKLEVEFSESIASQIQEDYAMMDTSDGLADALFKIVEASGVSVEVKEIEGMFGAEDYKLVAAVPEDFLPKLSEYELLGKVLPKQNYVLKIGDKKYFNYEELGLYDHFRRNDA